MRTAQVWSAERDVRLSRCLPVKRPPFQKVDADKALRPVDNVKEEILVLLTERLLAAPPMDGSVLRLCWSASNQLQINWYDSESWRRGLVLCYALKGKLW